MLHKRVLGRGPELVLLHGWGMNGAVWGGLAERLAARWRVTVLDLPGHGDSPYRPGRTSFCEWTGDCLAAAPERAVWVGWSLGGAFAMAAALRAPERVRALVAVAATPRFVQAPDWPHAMPRTTLEQFHEALVTDPSATLDRFLALQVRGGEAARATLRDLRRRLAGRPPPDEIALDVGLELLGGTDLRERLPGLACPSLWLYGARDTLVPCSVVEALQPRIPQARFEVIPGAAHAPFLSHPARSLALLEAFLATLP